ncbi:50S ribosomal protein L23 [Candidatus Protochlamydia phocaeensis]|uniref:50S ribosomal protein L23 n=1 Tax=Candidatus Protochlamydia phocaeensis TaxID=1414722 RepID=UPI0008389D30|nr:50S ribosomal protein L23 [Candidatus Protochlamydia phocaeensis]
MTRKSPYQVIKHQYVTEKSMMLQRLKTAESNRSLKRCESPKYVFIVDRSANKEEIAQAVEEIYKNEDVKVVAVNTINVKAKARRVRGRPGFKNAFKKAIVTLRAGDSLDNV